MSETKLVKGEHYEAGNFHFIEWTEGDGSGHEGYDAWDYFTRDGTYRGPDRHGIEPLFDHPHRPSRVYGA